MSTTEKAVQEGLQTILRSITGTFATGDVVINDWSILDGGMISSPYVIITNSDDFTARKDTSATQTTWNVPFLLFVEFEDWDTSLNSFRDVRQTIIDTLNSGDNRTANGIDGLDVEIIRSAAPIDYWYDPSLPPEAISNATPQFIYQMMIYEAKEF